jgi:hypothetical protein
MHRLRIQIPQQKKSKYNNKKCIVNGITFPSIKEGKRYASLLLQEKAGEIFKLKLQVPFKILINGQLVCTYKADFTYYTKSGNYIVEDCKGVRTPVYKLKKRLLLLTHSIEILET